MVDVWLPYGNTEICLMVPTKNFLGSIGPKDKRGAENPQLEIERSLKEPFGSNRLSEVAKPGGKVCIVVNSVEDSKLTLLMLKSILMELNEAGVANNDIRIVRGYDPLYGYAAMDNMQLQSDEAFKGVELITHDPEARSNIYVGETALKTKIYLNRIFTESNLKILAGILDPHPYAGYSGGRDGVLPGVSSIETIQHNLSMVTDPKARSGIIEGNPIHEDMTQAAHLSGASFILNVVRNSKREVIKSFAGHPDDAFKRAVEFADEIYKIPVEKRADAVFVSPGGFPFDADLCESCRGIENVLEAVKKNGVVVLVAECSKGYGNSDFYKWIVELRDHKKMEHQLKRRFTRGGYVAYSLMKVLQRCEVMLVSALPDYYASETLNLKTARTANEALRYVLDATKGNAKVSAISHGSLTIPMIKL